MVAQRRALSLWRALSFVVVRCHVLLCVVVCGRCRLLACVIAFGCMLLPDDVCLWLLLFVGVVLALAVCCCACVHVVALCDVVWLVRVTRVLFVM